MVVVIKETRAPSLHLSFKMMDESLEVEVGCEATGDYILLQRCNVMLHTAEDVGGCHEVTEEGFLLLVEFHIVLSVRILTVQQVSLVADGVCV